MGARVLLRDLQPGTTYFLQIRGKNGLYYSPWSNIFQLDTIADVVPPLPVTDLVWEANGTAFRASWTPPTFSEDGTPCYDLADYVVKVWAPADGAVVGLPAPDPAKIVTFVSSGPRFDFSFEQNVNAFDYPRGKVAIEVRARDTTGNVSAPTFATAQNPVPAQVPAFTATGMMDSIAFDWTKNASPPDDDIKFYRIRQGTTAGTVNTIIAETNDVHTEWATINSAMQYFSITAVDVFYQESATRRTAQAQARSSVEIDTTPPGAPTSVTTSAGLDTTDPNFSRTYIQVNWVKPTATDLQEYSIRWSSDQTNWQYMTVPAEESDGTAVQTARIYGLVAGQSYYVQVKSIDFTANNSAWVNSATYPQTTAKDTTAPSTPVAPTLASNTMQIQVTHSLLKASGGNLETDLDHLEVFASTTSGFTPSASNQLGEIAVTPPPISGTPVSAVQTFSIPAGGGASQTWYAKVIAVDNAGNKSSASAQSSASVPLIANTNIQDATITNAKISDLSVSKITAGTGTAFDWTINNTLTMGSASTNGVMTSYDYVPGGTTGWRIEKGGFTVNNGLIAARALKLQDGQNILHPAYADFEWVPSWYTSGNITTGNGATFSMVGNWAKYGDSCIKHNSTTTASSVLYLAASNASYNIQVESNTEYILSAWAYTDVGSTISVQLDLRESDGTFKSVQSAASVPNGVWTRVSGVFTTGATTTDMLVYLVLNSLSSYVYWDGIQLERKVTAETAPSPWTPPSYTSIDGGQIRTGSIQSTAFAKSPLNVDDPTQPAWSINTQGGAQLGNVNVRGTIFVGPTGSNDPNSAARSGVYVTNASDGVGAGWIIKGDGYAEFNNVLVRGNIQATSGTFTNTVVVGNSASASHTVSSFNYNPSSAGWRIRGDGYAEFNNVLVRGTVYATSGAFSGDITGATGTFSGNLSGSTIYGGTIYGATITSATGTGQRITINSGGYNKILFYPNNGEITPADIRVGESGAAGERFIQVYSGDYGYGRALLSVGAPRNDYGLGPEIDLVAAGGTIYFSATSYNFNSGSLNVEGAVAAGNGVAGTYRIAIGSFASSEGFVQGRGTASTGIRLGTDAWVRIVDNSGSNYNNLRASSLYSETTVSGASAYTNRSDPRLKEAIQPMDMGLNVIRQAPAKKWKWKDKQQPDREFYGLLTSDLPSELVTVVQPPDPGEESHEAITLYDLIGVLWHAVRELDMELDDVRELITKKKPDIKRKLT